MERNQCGVPFEFDKILNDLSAQLDSALPLTSETYSAADEPHQRDSFEPSGRLNPNDELDAELQTINSEDLSKTSFHPPSIDNLEQIERSHSPLFTSTHYDHARAFKWLRQNYTFLDSSEIPEGTSPPCIAKHELYDGYCKFCSDNSARSISNADFGKVVKTAFPNVVSRRLGQRGHTKYFYSGLKKIHGHNDGKFSQEFSFAEQVPFGLRFSPTNSKHVTSPAVLRAASNVVLEWACKLLGKDFKNINQLALFLLKCMYVNCRSPAAYMLIEAMEDEKLTTGLDQHVQNKPEPSKAGSTFSSTDISMHRSVQLQLKQSIIDRSTTNQNTNELSDTSNAAGLIRSNSSAFRPLTPGLPKSQHDSPRSSACRTSSVPPENSFRSSSVASQRSISRGVSKRTYSESWAVYNPRQDVRFRSNSTAPMVETVTYLPDVNLVACPLNQLQSGQVQSYTNCPSNRIPTEDELCLEDLSNIEPSVTTSISSLPYYDDQIMLGATEAYEAEFDADIIDEILSLTSDQNNQQQQQSNSRSYFQPSKDTYLPNAAPVDEPFNKMARSANTTPFTSDMNFNDSSNHNATASCIPFNYVNYSLESPRCFSPR